MKIKKTIVIVITLLLSLAACSSKNSEDLSKLIGKSFTTQSGGQILVIDENGKKSLSFRGDVVIKPNTDPKKLNKNDAEKEKGGIFKNPKIVVENGKKYLTAEDFKFKLIVKDDSTIVDEENGKEYKTK